MPNFLSLKLELNFSLPFFFQKQLKESMDDSVTEDEDEDDEEGYVYDSPPPSLGD